MPKSFSNYSLKSKDGGQLLIDEDAVIQRASQYAKKALADCQKQFDQMNQIDYRASKVKKKQFSFDANQYSGADDVNMSATEVGMTGNFDQKQKSNSNEDAAEVDTNKPPSSVYDEEYHAEAQDQQLIGNNFRQNSSDTDQLQQASNHLLFASNFNGEAEELQHHHQSADVQRELQNLDLLRENIM